MAIHLVSLKQNQYYMVNQVRDRTFYFFWKGDEVPLFELSLIHI